jgi:hypothetical protein
MAELPDEIGGEVQRLCAEGEDFADEGEFGQALSRYQAAWDLLPEPREDWGEALWILTAIGDAHFLNGNWQGCRDALQRAVKGCDGAVENPFVRLRLGQALFEQGDLREAGNWMAPAYLTEGKKLFAGEDPKYLAFLKTQLHPPPGGWPKGW